MKNAKTLHKELVKAEEIVNDQIDTAIAVLDAMNLNTLVAMSDRTKTSGLIARLVAIHTDFENEDFENIIYGTFLDESDRIPVYGKTLDKITSISKQLKILLEEANA